MRIAFAYPAYGREYSAKEQVLLDWNEGKDFRLDSPNGPYFSIRDIASLGTRVQIVLAFGFALMEEHSIYYGKGHNYGIQCN